MTDIKGLTFRLVGGSYQRGGLKECHGKLSGWVFEATCNNGSRWIAKPPNAIREFERMERLESLRKAYGND